VATNKKTGPWKASSASPQPMSLSNFMPKSTTAKTTATNTYQSTDRSPARKHGFFITVL